MITPDAAAHPTTPSATERRRAESLSGRVRFTAHPVQEVLDSTLENRLPLMAIERQLLGRDSPERHTL